MSLWQVAMVGLAVCMSKRCPKTHSSDYNVVTLSVHCCLKQQQYLFCFLNVFFFIFADESDSFAGSAGFDGPEVSYYYLYCCCCCCCYPNNSRVFTMKTVNI